MMLPATSPAERVMILKQGQAAMSPEVFQETLKVAENENFQKVKEKSGLLVFFALLCLQWFFA
jgi:hypothetical protein